MSGRRIAAVAWRIAEGFRRDRRSLALLVVAPIVVMGLLGWVMRGSTGGSVEVTVAGAPASVLAALRSAAADAPDDTHVGFGSADSPAAARDAVRRGASDLALLVAVSGTGLDLTIVSPGADPATESGQIAAVQQVVLSASSALLAGSGAAVPRIVHETIFLPTDADQLDALAPVFLGFFAYFFVFVLTGISFLRERVGGTLERLLATPISRGEIVLGYSLGFSIFAAIQVLLLTAFVLARVEVPGIGPVPAFTIGLDVHVAGSPAFAFIVALLLAVGAVNLGIFLSTFARTELQVVQFIPLVIVPQGLLGGLVWPVDRLPDVLQLIAHLLPVTYAVEALRAVMIEGADLGSATVRLDLAVLTAIAVVFVVLAGATIKREVA